MIIDRIGSIEPLIPEKKNSRTESVQKKTSSDSIDLSSEALQKGELYQAVEIASNAEDVRADRIAEVRAKLEDPNYIDDAVLNKTAENILAAFGL